MPLPALRRQKFLTPSASDAVSPGWMPVDEVDHPPHALPAAQDRRRRCTGWPNRFDPHAVGADQADEPQRRRELLGILQLGRLAKIHRQAGVDQREEVQVFFFEKQLDDELVEPGVQIPIERPQVVARHVAAKVGELDALPFALAPPLALHPPAKHLARDQLQPFELGHEVGREER